MKRILISFLLLFSSISFAQTPGIETLRKEYYKVKTDSATCAALYQKISTSTPTDNLLIAYKGAITAAMADHSANKAEKLKLFNTGKKMLEQVIKTDSSNLELRFLRFTIQTSCPKALGYNKQIATDKKFILSHFDTFKNSEFKAKMWSYLLNSTALTEEEKKKLKSGSN